MKRGFLTAAAILMSGLFIGCGEIKDATDLTFYITRNYVFTVRGDSTTLAYNINLEDDDDYERYKNKIRQVRIEYFRYSITSNAGGGGTGDFYAGPYGSAFSSAVEVAQTISFASGETRGSTDVQWVNQGYLESLLSSGKLSLWAVGNGSGIDIIVPVEIKIEITVNLLE